MSADRINSMVRRYRSIVEPYVRKMPDSMHEPLTSSQYDTVANQLHSEIEQNYQTYRTGFNKPMPFYIGKPTPTNGKLKLSWDVSYDFNDEDLRYTVTVAKDYEGKDVVFTQSDLVLPEAVMDMPGEGQYFIKVSVRNASGETQDAFDYYVTDGNKIYGTKCFYVKADGEQLSVPPRTAKERFRHELKYLISYAQKADLNVRMAPLLGLDKHAKNGGYMIRSLYFDDYWNTAYQEKVDGVLLRRKYRIRIYDYSDRVIKLERKRKSDSFMWNACAM